MTSGGRHKLPTRIARSTAITADFKRAETLCRRGRTRPCAQCRTRHPANSGIDLVARLLAEPSKAVDQPGIMENRAGAAGMIAAPHRGTRLSEG